MRGAPGLVAACLMSACASIGTPGAGQAVTVKQDQALVFGRIRMVDAGDEAIAYAPFRFDPWGGPFFTPLPRLSLELRQLLPPGGAMRYRSHPSPPIGEDGTFAWILHAGDYQLLGNPRLLGSRRYDPDESGTLARFAVPPSGGTVYVGTLLVRVAFDLVQMALGWKRDEIEYTIVGYSVFDERDAELASLRARFAALPEPVRSELMRAP